MYRKIHTLLLLVLLSCTGSFKIQASETIELYSDIYNSPEEVPEPESGIEASKGEPLMLLRTEIEMIPVTGRKKQLASQIIYSGVGQDDLIPQQASVLVEDEESGLAFDMELPLKEQFRFNERWEDFTFKVTFHAYGSDQYRLGENEFHIGDGQPKLAGAENEMLALIGMDKDSCRIGSYEWSGAIYQDLTGEDCRDALAFASRRVWDCKALYGQETKLPDYSQYRRRSVYAGPAWATGDFEVREPEEGAEAPKAENKQAESLWNRLLKIYKEHLRITVGLGLLLLLLAALYLLVRLARKAEEHRR